MPRPRRLPSPRTVFPPTSIHDRFTLTPGSILVISEVDGSCFGGGEALEYDGSGGYAGWRISGRDGLGGREEVEAEKEERNG